MIGARDMESAILGQYADFVRKKHPDAPVPGFYLAEGLFKDARDLRAQIGDGPFFTKLNEGATGGWWRRRRRWWWRLGRVRQRLGRGELRSRDAGAAATAKSARGSWGT
jgi:hypothetical protein